MTTDIFTEIENLLQYAIRTNLIEEYNTFYSRNLILDVLGLDSFYEPNSQDTSDSLDNTLDRILDWAYENKILKHNSNVYRELLETRIMNCLMPRPSEVIKTFDNLYDKDPYEATAYFFNQCIHSNYIKTRQIAKNKVWKAETEYGNLDLTINLSKPEKDPIAIAEALKSKPSSYPSCLLCRENEGYSGRLDHPARQNLRLIPITLNNENWFFQYSPYAYYNEHSIVLNENHTPMKIDEFTFEKLFEFIEKFPHYFIGSNADLPIVGGSILSHDHFQAGRYDFAMAQAPIEQVFLFEKFKGVSVAMVRWPMSVIRLCGANKDDVLKMCNLILHNWKSYNNDNLDIISYTESTPHNTITPIARRRDKLFEIDLVLRNNRTSLDHPLGIFHPHDDVHHVKKENIGLIEVMGLAILPGRLDTELELLSMYLKGEKNNPEKDASMEKHLDWYYYLKSKYPKSEMTNEPDILKHELGIKFLTVLEHAGVFKRDPEGIDAFADFIRSCFV